MPKIIKNQEPQSNVTRYELQSNLMDLAKQYETYKKDQRENQDEMYIDPMDDALKRCQEILDVAREEAVKIKEEAYEEGFAAGVQEGKQEGYWQVQNDHGKKLEQQRAELAEDVERSIHGMEEQKHRLLNQYVEDLKNISVAIAEKVMRVSLQSSGDIMKRMIISATEKLSKTQWVKIYISKLDAELMIDGDTQLLNSLSYLSDNIKIIPMDNEEQGTCIIELPKEIIDASISTQMENIRSILNNVQL